MFVYKELMQTLMPHLAAEVLNSTAQQTRVVLIQYLVLNILQKTFESTTTKLYRKLKTYLAPELPQCPLSALIILINAPST